MRMAKAEATTARAPRGTRVVSQAFFAALDSVPEATRPAVAKAAQVLIRDELKSRREKLKAAATKDKARRATAKQPSKRSAPVAADEVSQSARPKRRARKQADISAAA